jgi:hypothetical protein
MIPIHRLQLGGPSYALLLLVISINVGQKLSSKTLSLSTTHIALKSLLEQEVNIHVNFIELESACNRLAALSKPCQLGLVLNFVLN